MLRLELDVDRGTFDDHLVLLVHRRDFFGYVAVLFRLFQRVALSRVLLQEQLLRVLQHIKVLVSTKAPLESRAEPFFELTSSRPGSLNGPLLEVLL